MSNVTCMKYHIMHICQAVTVGMPLLKSMHTRAHTGHAQVSGLSSFNRKKEHCEAARSVTRPRLLEAEAEIARGRGRAYARTRILVRAFEQWGYSDSHSGIPMQSPGIQRG